MLNTVQLETNGYVYRFGQSPIYYILLPSFRLDVATGQTDFFFI